MSMGPPLGVPFWQSDSRFNQGDRRFPPERKDKILCEIAEAINKIEGGNDKGIRGLCTELEGHILQFKATMNPEQKLVLEPFYRKVLEQAYVVAILYNEGHSSLRDNTNVLPTLTAALNDGYQESDHTLILKAIEAISRGIVLSWCFPFISHLTKEAYSILTTARPTSENFLYALRILNNLAFHNQDCLNMMAKDSGSRNVSKALFALLSNEQTPKAVLVLAYNFILLTESTFIPKLQQAQSIELCFKKLSKDLQADPSLWNLREAGGTIFYLNISARALFRIYFNDYLKEGREVEEQKLGLKTGSIWNIKSLISSLGNAVVREFCGEILHPIIESLEGQVLIDSLCQMLFDVLSVEMSSEIFLHIEDYFLQPIDTLAAMSRNKTRVQLVILRACLCYLDKLAAAGCAKNFNLNSLANSWKNCDVMKTTTTIDITRNILTVRWTTRNIAVLQAQGQDRPENLLSDVTQKLAMMQDFNVLTSMLNRLLDEHTPLSIEASTCSIEILYLISQLANGTQHLMAYLGQDAVLYQVANCITSGDPDVMAQVFALMTSVVFSQKCRTGVAQHLMSFRAMDANQRLSAALPSVAGSLEFPPVAARRAMQRLFDNLELFEQNFEAASDLSIDDVLSWYKLKNEIHDMELSNMREQVFHLNRTNLQLRNLMTKQEDLIASKTVAAAASQKDQVHITRQLVDTQTRKQDLEEKHAKAMDTLKLQLELQEKVAKTKSLRVTQVEKILLDLQEKYSNLQQMKEDADEACRNANIEMKKLKDKLSGTENDLSKLKQRCSSLEADLKQTQESRKAVEAQLEAERRKTEIIQQVLGNRLN